MKIEKINDRQIRCILTKEDLEDRKIRLSELVCGGEKARGLLRDMMTRAARELGFSFNNNPLMIEAVPTGKDQLVLIITRVDDPKELDSRFKNLSGTWDTGKEEDALRGPGDETVAALTGADDILNLLREFSKRLKEKEEQPSAPEQKTEKTRGKDSAGRKESVSSGREKEDSLSEEEIYQYTRFYVFRSLENVLNASKRVPAAYTGENALYKNPEDGAFYLLVKKMDTNPEQFNRICNLLSEYAMPMDYTTGMDEFFREHMKVIVDNFALQRLRVI